MNRPPPRSGGGSDDHPRNRSVTLYKLIDYRPHSSPDPSGHPPGGGDFYRPVGAADGSMPRPYNQKKAAPEGAALRFTWKLTDYRKLAKCLMVRTI